MKILNNKSGAAVLVGVLILSAVITALAITLGLSSITESEITLHQSKTLQLFANTDACMEEALTQMARNHKYTGETLTIGNTSCTISVTGSGMSKTITAAATLDDYRKKFQTSVTLAPTFSITDWQELAY